MSKAPKKSCTVFSYRFRTAVKRGCEINKATKENQKIVVTTSKTEITTKVNSPTVGSSMVENKLKKKRVALGFRTFVIKPIRIARNGEIRLETVTVS